MDENPNTCERIHLNECSCEYEYPGEPRLRCAACRLAFDSFADRQAEEAEFAAWLAALERDPRWNMEVLEMSEELDN